MVPTIEEVPVSTQIYKLVRVSVTVFLVYTTLQCPAVQLLGLHPLPSCCSVLGQLWFLQLVRSHEYRAKMKGR